MHRSAGVYFRFINYSTLPLLSLFAVCIAREDKMKSTEYVECKGSHQVAVRELISLSVCKTLPVPRYCFQGCPCIFRTSEPMLPVLMSFFPNAS